jgi:hypothetical protein
VVQEEQVDPLDPELGSALVERVQCLLVAVVADPDLGLNEDVVAVEARAPDRFANLAFVGVSGGGIDVAVADGERRFNGARCLLWRVWNTPRPIAGISTPLLSRRIDALFMCEGEDARATEGTDI